MDGGDLPSVDGAPLRSEPLARGGDKTAEPGTAAPPGPSVESVSGHRPGICDGDPLPSGGDETAEPTSSDPTGPSREVGSGHRLEGCDALARAISTTLGAVMKEFNSRAEGTTQSQDELSLSLDRLTGELDKLLEDAPLPFIMQHATKISSIRRRVSSLNLLLKSIQRRIDNIDRMLSTGIPNEKVPPDIVTASSFAL